MGKSYKRTPIIKDNGNSKKSQKRQATHSVRNKLKRGIEISNGNAYKKHYESYDIADYVCRWTKEEAIKQYEKPCRYSWETNWKEEYPTLEDFLNYWEKCMRRK